MATSYKSMKSQKLKFSDFLDLMICKLQKSQKLKEQAVDLRSTSCSMSFWDFVFFAL